MSSEKSGEQVVIEHLLYTGTFFSLGTGDLVESPGMAYPEDAYILCEGRKKGRENIDNFYIVSETLLDAEKSYEENR